MKVNVYNIDGEVEKQIDLPTVFEIMPREDLIHKAFKAITLSLRQPYGSSPAAGTRRVGHNLGPNHGISRIPRIAGGSRGVLLASMVGGRSAHSPRSDKVLYKKINSKELKYARLSAIALTASKEHIIKRGHRLDEDTTSNLTFPIVVDNDIESINKAKDAMKFLQNLGLLDDVIRAKNGVKIRPGRGKMRNRPYKHPKSVLIVGSSQEKLRAFAGLPGVDVATINSLSIRKLAPGGNPGRLTVYTENVIEQLRGVY
ncbi:MULTISPECIES: 50S ribosomal protein L4 [Acidiplasma]|uniref:Large ribosomal subunit protein uL4 n=1 Tax=Acidiplasma aeolicum TaxID=507754 RepID=A0A0Q0XMB9_9ARCH|nr:MULTISPECIES: 50S ribosomal protein L4 [Acidiplasma]KJE49469.1 50S ribosomal protein L4 [Acidiplasma sp. MBA-1]KPV46401.1 50S ribosomal protein L4 [Acidiplasma aeolicum]KQB36717.1 50S ribosomal protein L4 [Acidiplasma aeolicum]WMT54550.1 MAG: 50S ribosomal protein L4 [Acidiplasma sp.]